MLPRIWGNEPSLARQGARKERQGQGAKTMDDVCGRNEEPEQNSPPNLRRCGFLIVIDNILKTKLQGNRHIYQLRVVSCICSWCVCSTSFGGDRATRLSNDVDIN
jgi:hypothetical protein